MKIKNFGKKSTTLEEDFQTLGVPLVMELGESKVADIEEDDEVEDSVDPLDEENVNNELFDAIMDLPFDNMSEDDVNEVLEALKDKNLPEDDEELAKRAEEVVEFLVSEAVAKKTRRARAGKMAKKASYQCPEGTRKDPSDPSGRRCVRAAKAAGGAGKLAKQKREKKKWTRSGKGTMSKKKSSRWAKRRGESDTMGMSEFAMELCSLVEDQNEEKTSVRDDIVDRIGSIFEMLSEEFLDEAVNRVFAESYEPLYSALDSGRLDEDLMAEEDFVTEIRPALTLITKSLDRIYKMENGELGNE